MFRPVFAICTINMIFCLALCSAATSVSAQTAKQPPVNPPNSDRPPPGGPEQHEISAMPSDIPIAVATSEGSTAVLRADLVLTRSFKLGSANISWGERGVVSAADAISKTLGKCVFQYRYITRNQGQMAASPVTNRVFLGAQNGGVLASAILPALAKNAQASSIGEVALMPGVSMLYVRADAVYQVTESDEANNLQRIRVTVQGDCTAQ